MLKEKQILINYLKQHQKKITSQRMKLLEFFLKHEKHLNPHELYYEIRKIYPKFGWATVYRTLKLLKEAQLASEIKFDGYTRYEHKYKHSHHDHLICTVCGKASEFSDEKIENIQTQIAKKFKFSPTSHVLAIYGVCNKCRRKEF